MATTTKMPSANEDTMKRTLLLALVICSVPAFLAAQIGIYQHGTVVRMHMGDCAAMHRGFMQNFGAPQAQVIDFRFHNNELAVRVDDAKHESKFVIREMTLRSQWDRIQKHIDEELNDQSRHPQDTALALRNRE